MAGGEPPQLPRATASKHDDNARGELQGAWPWPSASNLHRRLLPCHRWKNRSGGPTQRLGGPSRPR